MNLKELDQLKKLIINVAEYYGRELKPQVVTMMATDLEDLDFAMVQEAYNKYRRGDKLMRFPMPSQIREIADPTADEKNVAVDVIRRIWTAVVKRGYTWDEGYSYGDGRYWWNNGVRYLLFSDAVSAELGPIAWNVIQARGGWKSVCDSANSMDEGQFIAQGRDHALAQIALAKQGIHTKRLEMPVKEGMGLPPSVRLKMRDMPK